MKQNLFEYDNYRAFLNDYYKTSKNENKNFSFRYFSRLVGYTSPNFLKCVIEGTRNLTDDGIERFAKALKFNKEETSFFRDLVHFNQAKDIEQKKKFARNIFRSRSYKKLLPLKEAQFLYFAQWYLVPIRELVALESFKEDPEWIAEALQPAITSAQAQHALNDLLKLGLIERNAQGRLVQTSQDVTTPDEIISVFKADCLTELIRLGGESIKRIPRERRDISGVTFSLSEEALTEIKEKARLFRRDILEIAAKFDNTGDNIYQLNIQIFPLTDARVKRTK